MSNPEQNKTIAKNTLLLYFRMIAVTVLSLVIVKYTLSVLGVEDFGIYNVIGGAVTFLTFLTTMVSSATQRFLAYELGSKDGKGNYNNIFCLLLLLFVAISIGLLIVFEVIAYPLIHSWLNIPPERFSAAFWVYQCSVASLIFNTLSIPFISSLFAHERLGVYAYIAIADVLLKSLLLLFVFYLSGDKLILYSIGMALVALLTNAVYVYYHQKRIENSKIYFFWDNKFFKKLCGYTGWTVFGSLSGIMLNQGLSILMNLFFGVAVNAAKGISDRVLSLLRSFVVNFYMAVSPQITKHYASGNIDYTLKLAYASTRFGYFLLFVLSLPTIIMLEEILTLWLGEKTQYDMVVFSKLSLIFALVNAFETPITFMINATGKVKKYQICVGVFTILIVPISYIAYKMGADAYWAFWIEIIIYAFVQIIRVAVAKSYYPITFKKYFFEAVYSPLIITSAVLIALFALSYINVPKIAIAAIVTLIMLVLIWAIGLKKNEKSMLVAYLKSKVK